MASAEPIPESEADAHLQICEDLMVLNCMSFVANMDSSMVTLRNATREQAEALGELIIRGADIVRINVIRTSEELMVEDIKAVCKAIEGCGRDIKLAVDETSLDGDLAHRHPANQLPHLWITHMEVDLSIVLGPSAPYLATMTHCLPSACVVAATSTKKFRLWPTHFCILTTHLLRSGCATAISTQLWERHSHACSPVTARLQPSP